MAVIASTKKIALYIGLCFLLMMLTTMINTYASTNSIRYNVYYDNNENLIEFYNATNFYDGDFVLSAPPGFHSQPFELIVSIPLIPNAVIYYTIDGNEPQPGDDRFLIRNEYAIQVSGRLPESGEIEVQDRSGYWRYAILSYHSHRWQQWIWHEQHRHLLWRFGQDRVLPAYNAEILQGTAFRFRGFVDGEPVTETITVTYIIAENAIERFANKPIVAITAPYQDFRYIYGHALRTDFTTRRRIFNYEYFELINHGYDYNYDYRYTRIFNLPGSSSLGGFSSRANAQRTINVHFARGELDGVITHPIFPELYELYRFRLWNSGNGFISDFMRDPFAQTASIGLNVPFADNNLAIKFVNGEFWGFTTIREHTSNRHFVSTRFEIEARNVAIIDRNAMASRAGRFDSVAEGNEATVMALYNELAEFLMSNDMASDYARERLFDEFFCQYNFMDYLIVNTFFNNSDWPHNNVRLFRAITPNLDSANSYNDGRWRFILHDMDFAPRPDSPRYTESRFPYLYRLHYRVYEWELWLNYAFLVLNNPTFAQQFRERAIYVLDNHFDQETLLALHDEFILQYEPLLPEMYNRFAIRVSVSSSIDNFYRNRDQLRYFLTNREYHYRKQLDALIDRLNVF